ncbi:hypothetical protein FRB96_000146 [Tulasnella sp. 330]|nr:hypothetical protein FRB96_000146 [Tulasnella sp. 330]
MASTTAQAQATRGRNGNKRGGGRRHYNRGGRGGSQVADQVETAPATATIPNVNEADITKSVPTVDETISEDSEDVCWICAEKIKYFSIAECNHTTCHVCALRLRALYRRQECTFCKHPQTSLVVTATTPQPYPSYDLPSMPNCDPKLSIYFETAEMLEDCLLLLRFNCPDADCDFIASGWADLKWHVRDRHGRLLWNASTATTNSTPTSANVTKNASSVKSKGLCTNKQKFVVFPTEMDLKGHSVEEHGDAMTGRDRRDAHRLDMSFATPSYAESRRGGGGGGGGAQTIRARAGGTPVPPEPTPSPGDSRAAGGGSRRAAFGAALTSATFGQSTPTATSSGGRGFGAMEEVDPEHATQQVAFVEHVQSVVSSPNGQTAVRHAVKSWRSSESTVYDMLGTIFTVLDRNMDKTTGVITRLLDVFEGEKKDELEEAWNGMKMEQRRQFPTLGNGARNQNQSIPDYASVSSGRVLNVKHSVKSGGQKKGSPRTVWDRVERAAASTSLSSGDAGPSSGPVRLGASGKPVPGSGVSTPTGGSSSFPALSSGGPTTAHRIAQRSTPWTTAGAGVVPHTPTPSVPSSTPPPIRPYSVPANRQNKDGGRKNGEKSAAPMISKAGFPALPTTEPVVVPRVYISGNQSLRNIGGGPSMPAVNAWSGGTPNAGPSEAGSNNSGQIRNVVANDGGGKEKKKKGKAKETLFTLGSHRA